MYFSCSILFTEATNICRAVLAAQALVWCQKHSALFPLAHGYQYQNGTQHRKCMVSSHDLCLLLIAQALDYAAAAWRLTTMGSPHNGKMR